MIKILILTNRQGLKDVSTSLLYKVKIQYVRLSNIVDTSIKHSISGQSTPMVEGCSTSDCCNNVSAGDNQEKHNPFLSA